MSALSKSDWVLLLLHQRPLGRIRLTAALFLIWHRTGRKLEGFYTFTPGLFGPFSFDLYSDLVTLYRNHLISQIPHSRHSSYYLTPKGASRAVAARDAVSPEVMELIQKTAAEVVLFDLAALRQRVYNEAPDFAPWRLRANEDEENGGGEDEDSAD